MYMGGTREGGGRRLTSFVGVEGHCSDDGDGVLLSAGLPQADGGTAEEHHSRWKSVDPVEKSCHYSGLGSMATPFHGR